MRHVDVPQVVGNRDTVRGVFGVPELTA